VIEKDEWADAARTQLRQQPAHLKAAEVVHFGFEKGDRHAPMVTQRSEWQQIARAIRTRKCTGGSNPPVLKDLRY